jgi:hypothetical protein
MNEFTNSKYGYEFFNRKNLILTTMGYISLYFGYQWYMKALANNGDLLNGQLLLAVGAMFVIYVIWENIKETSLLVGVTFSAIQLFLYIGISALSILAVFGMLAAVMPYRNGYYYDD